MELEFGWKACKLIPVQRNVFEKEYVFSWTNWFEYKYFEKENVLEMNVDFVKLLVLWVSQ